MKIVPPSLAALAYLTTLAMPSIPIVGLRDVASLETAARWDRSTPSALVAGFLTMRSGDPGCSPILMFHPDGTIYWGACVETACGETCHRVDDDDDPKIRSCHCGEVGDQICEGDVLVGDAGIVIDWDCKGSFNGPTNCQEMVPGGFLPPGSPPVPFLACDC